MKTSEQMMESFLNAAGAKSATDAGDGIKSLIDAQVQFMNQLMGFQDLLLESSTKAVDKIMTSITTAKIQEITPETYRTLYDTLLNQIEGSFSEFLNSDDFARALSEAVTSGTEAREKLERVISDWVTLMNLPSRKDMDEIRETLAAMQEKIDSLEQKVEELSRVHSELPCKT
jgi:polyhydroxyalkanoate synthesis regulator phasin